MQLSFKLIVKKLKERPNLLEPVVRFSVAEIGAAMPTYRGTNHVAPQRGVKS